MASPSLGGAVKSASCQCGCNGAVLRPAPRPEEAGALVCLCPPLFPPRVALFSLVRLCVTERGSPRRLPAVHTRAGPPFRRKVLAGSQLRLFTVSPPAPVHPPPASAGGSREHLRRTIKGLSSRWGCASLSGALNLQTLASHCARLVAVASLLSLLRASLSGSTLLPPVALCCSPALGCCLSGSLVLADQAAWPSSCRGEAPPALGDSRPVAEDFHPERGDTAPSSGVCSVLLEKK